MADKVTLHFLRWQSANGSHTKEHIMAARKPAAVLVPTTTTVTLSKDKETKNMVRYSTDESVVLPTVYVGKEAFGDADNTSFPESITVDITF